MKSVVQKAIANLRWPLTARSLAFEITLAILSAATVVTVISLLLHVSIVTKQDSDHFNQRGNAHLRSLTKSLELPLWNYDGSAVRKIGAAALGHDLIASLTITDQAGKVIYQAPEFTAMVTLVKSAAVSLQGTPVGAVQLGLTNRVYRERQTQNIYFGLCTILAMIAGIGLIVIGSVRLFIRRPLQLFSDAIRALHDGRFQQVRGTTIYREFTDIWCRFQQMGREISAREQALVAAHREISDREERYRTLNENIPVGIFRSTYAGRLLSINPALMKMLGIAPTHTLDAINTHHFFLNADDCRRMRAEIRNTKGTTGFQAQLKGRNGVPIWGSITSNAIEDDAGNVLYIDGIVEDITANILAGKENKHLHAQLLQAQRMEAVGHLAGGIAHDFNNMLSIVIGNTELLLDDLPADASSRSLVQSIYTAGLRSSDLVRQLLAYARKQPVQPELIQINEHIAQAIQMLHRLIGESIELAWIPGHHLPKILIDPSQLDQIITNLCVNARDAIAHVGTITLETQCVTVDDAYCRQFAGLIPGTYVRLTASDTGCGMDTNTLTQIFDPFFTTKPMGQGTGLGLATVYGIVKQNNGFIYPTSELGKGTAFKIFFPVASDEAQCAASGDDPVPIQTGSETVLLVEDDEILLELTTTILKKLGYQVMVANDPIEAIQIVKNSQRHIDLVLTDVVMPKMNGRELADRLRDDRPGLKALYMSGYPADVIARNGVLGQDIIFVAKPFSIVDLAEKVREALDRGETRGG